MRSKAIEIFCGTGGVGKTTLASARALQLASENKRVLLITIDPARRLKEVLKMQESESGKVQKIHGAIFGEHFTNVYLDALLLSPESTLLRIQQNDKTGAKLNNPIIKSLTRPYAGMNEIMGLLEVQYHFESGKYDTIVLDTPPGKHFIDFLLAAGKIKRFFDKSFIEIFKYLGKKIKGEKGHSGFIIRIVSSGIKKLLGQLEKVTGALFVEQFVDAVSALYQVQDHFLAGLQFQEKLKDSKLCHWILVTSAQQGKSNEATELLDEAKDLIHREYTLAINKCLGPFLNEWSPTKNSPLEALKKNMLLREEKLRQQFPLKSISNIMEFPEVLGSSPHEHVKELAHAWAKFV